MRLGDQYDETALASSVDCASDRVAVGMASSVDWTRWSDVGVYDGAAWTTLVW